MGTRGAYGFRKDGKDKITYCHFDSYPEGLGQVMLDFCKRHDIGSINLIESEITLLNADEELTPELIEKFKKVSDKRVSTGDLKDPYVALRKMQGEPEKLIEIPFMIDDHKFLEDSLFCEWAYIINLDTKRLEIYEGFCKTSRGLGRYANIGEPYKVEETTYYGVELIGEINLADDNYIEEIPLLEDITSMGDFCAGLVTARSYRRKEIE